MRSGPRLLLNFAEVELWPADLLKARNNHHARALSQARWGIRRKQDGRYLAAVTYDSAHVFPLVPSLEREPGVDPALAKLRTMRFGPTQPHGYSGTHPSHLHHLHRQLGSLGIDANEYQRHSGLHIIPEPLWLSFAGFDRYRRPLWLTRGASDSWNRMRHAAACDDVMLEAISGYRSHDYQLAIFKRKLANGQALAHILNVNAAPGYSEHHSGNALDLSTPGQPPIEESFENTEAFAWLTLHAADHGFRMSYPRDNPHRVIYEPW
ncbi:MAG: D-alanyl-D-alanine carboxypeptidase family protein, partial [Xanthomonadaceae bacterium]|nr:D-alanyl-D-alanine carboxypeptidase family protein [Xanthomonadaceae bacterium]